MRTTKFKNLIELWTKKTTKWTPESLPVKNSLITSLKSSNLPPHSTLIKDKGMYRQKAVQIAKTRNKIQTLISSHNIRNILTISSQELLLVAMVFKTSRRYCLRTQTKTPSCSKTLHPSQKVPSTTQRSCSNRPR